MIGRASLLAAMALTLGSCTAPDTPVEAYAEGGGVAFRVASDKLEYANCFAYLTIVDARGEQAWQLVSDYVSGPHETCPHAFPLRYGVVPRGVQASGAAVPLVPGRLYVIDGSATGRIVGAFRVSADGKVEQAEPYSAEARTAVEIHDQAAMNAAMANGAYPEVNAIAN